MNYLSLFIPVHCSEQTCSRPSWDTESFTGRHPPAFRYFWWQVAAILQRAGPADSSALYMLCEGGGWECVSGAWHSARHPAEPGGKLQLIWKRSILTLFFFFLFFKRQMIFFFPQCFYIFLHKPLHCCNCHGIKCLKRPKDEYLTLFGI